MISNINRFFSKSSPQMRIYSLLLRHLGTITCTYLSRSAPVSSRSRCNLSASHIAAQILLLNSIIKIWIFIFQYKHGKKPDGLAGPSCGVYDVAGAVTLICVVAR